MLNAIRSFFMAFLAPAPINGVSNATLWQGERLTDAELVDFTDWLASKPSGQTYDFLNTDVCLLTQYLRDHRKIAGACAGLDRWIDDRNILKDIPVMANEIASTEPHTFGAAYERANSYLTAEADLRATAMWIS